MKRFISFYILLATLLYGNILKTPLLSVNEDEATIAANGLKVGMSGFIVHQFTPDHSTIINTAIVTKSDGKNATLKLSKFTMFVNNNLPSFKLKAQKGDIAILAFGYNRGLLIAPNEKIYYTIKNAMRGEVLAHPDIFATLLSAHGHPSPQKEDFQTLCNNLSIGLLFFYIDQKLYSVDCNSFAIIDVQNAPLEQKNTQLPFYSRIEKIEANWFGAGSDEMKDYASYYKQLLQDANQNNTTILSEGN